MNTPERVADITRIHPEYNPRSRSERKGPIRIDDAFEPALALHAREHGKTKAESTFKLFHDKPDSTATISFISSQNQNSERIHYKAEISSICGNNPVMLGVLTADGVDVFSDLSSIPGYLGREKPASISDSEWSAWISDVQTLAACEYIAGRTEMEVHGDKKVSSSSLDKFLEVCQTWMGTDWPADLKPDDHWEQPAGMKFADVVHGISPHTIERKTEFMADNNKYSLLVLSDENDSPSRIELTEDRRAGADETRKWIYTPEGTGFSQNGDFSEDEILDATEDQAAEGIRLLDHLASRIDEATTLHVFLSPELYRGATIIDLREFLEMRRTET